MILSITKEHIVISQQVCKCGLSSFLWLYLKTLLVYCGFSVATFPLFFLLSVSAARVRFCFFSADLGSAYSPGIQVCSFKRSHRTGVSRVQQGSWVSVEVQNL